MPSLWSLAPLVVAAVVLVAWCAFGQSGPSAELRPAFCFTDHRVLQRGMAAPEWSPAWQVSPLARPPFVTDEPGE